MPTGCFTLIHCLMMNETGVIWVADVTACCFRLKGESVKKKGIEGSEKKKLSKCAFSTINKWGDTTRRATSQSMEKCALKLEESPPFKIATSHEQQFSPLNLLLWFLIISESHIRTSLWEKPSFLTSHILVINGIKRNKLLIRVTKFKRDQCLF